MESYWERFLKTGRPEDYLMYKTGWNMACKEETDQEKMKSESDRTDRHGAFYYAYRRI